MSVSLYPSQLGHSVFARRAWIGGTLAVLILRSWRVDHVLAGWCANNVAVIKDDADNIKPTKSKSDGRIDCIAALVTALSRAMLGGGQPKRSVYEDRAPYVPD